MQQSNRIHKELQENRNAIRSKFYISEKMNISKILAGDESRSGHKSPADRETPQSLPKADLSEEVSIYVPTTRTNIIRGHTYPWWYPQYFKLTIIQNLGHLSAETQAER